MKDLHGEIGKGWIGVDLDGTLAYYDGWKGPTVIGDPIPKMLKRVKNWVSSGQDVRIMTARVTPSKDDTLLSRMAIQKWLEEKCGLFHIPITHAKDHLMLELWDDRCIQVIPNTGERADGKE